MPLSTAATIDKLLAEATADPYHNVPRAVVIAANSKEVLYSGAAGYTSILPPYSDDWKDSLASADKVTDESCFDIFSATKVIAVIAAMQLIEQGRLSLDDDAGKYAPDILEVPLLKGFTEDTDEPIVEKNTTPITIRMLINHTGGFGYPWSEAWNKYCEKKKLKGVYSKGFDRKELAKLPLVHTPGTHFLYGVNNDWLSVVVEEISGLPLEDYFQKNIFGPLGIKDMSFHANPRKMSSARVSDTPGVPTTFEPGMVFEQGQDFGGAGISASPKSYLRILRALLNGGTLAGEGGGTILKPETVDLMFQPSFPNETCRKDLWEKESEKTDPFSKEASLAGKTLPVDFGLGGFLNGSDYPSGRQSGSLAWSGVMNTYWVVDRKSDLAFVVWQNTWDYSNDPAFNLWKKVEPELYKGRA